MPQLFCGIVGTAKPYQLKSPMTTNSYVSIIRTVAYPWQDASTTTYTPEDTETARSAYDTTQKTVDTRTLSWILYAVQGVDWPMLVKELDVPANIETALAGANWAPLAKIAGGLLFMIPQI